MYGDCCNDDIPSYLSLTAPATSAYNRRGETRSGNCARCDRKPVAKPVLHSGMMRPVVAISVGYYTPAVRAGGPVRSISNIVERLGDEFDFRIITPNYDVGDYAPLEGTDTTQWSPVGKALVRYLPLRMVRSGAVGRTIHEVKPDAVYFNSVFNPAFTIRPLVTMQATRRTQRHPSILVAPRGELGIGALRLKAAKKRVFLAASRVAKLYSGVTWHATSQEERSDVRRVFGHDTRIWVAPNLGTQAFLRARRTVRQAKEPGSLRLVFASRIMRKKNLHHLITALQRVRGRVVLTVYGAIEDPGYWRKCSQLAAELPSSIRVTHEGNVDGNDVPEALDQHDVFALPTLSENYGHAIIEALARGLPCIISNTTPWQDLDSRGVGNVVPVDDGTALAEAIQRFVDMDERTFSVMSASARSYGRERILDDDAVAATRSMLAACVGPSVHGERSRG